MKTSLIVEHNLKATALQIFDNPTTGLLFAVAEFHHIQLFVDEKGMLSQLSESQLQELSSSDYILHAEVEYEHQLLRAIALIVLLEMNIYYTNTLILIFKIILSKKPDHPSA